MTEDSKFASTGTRKFAEILADMLEVETLAAAFGCAGAEPGSALQIAGYFGKQRFIHRVVRLLAVMMGDGFSPK